MDHLPHFCAQELLVSLQVFRAIDDFVDLVLFLGFLCACFDCAVRADLNVVVVDNVDEGRGSLALEVLPGVLDFLLYLWSILRSRQFPLHCFTELVLRKPLELLFGDVVVRRLVLEYKQLLVMISLNLLGVLLPG